MRRLKPSSLIIVAAFFIGLSILALSAMDACASESNKASGSVSAPVKFFGQTPSATAIKDGESVVKLKNGNMYVGSNVKVGDGFVILTNVRFPEKYQMIAWTPQSIEVMYKK